MGNLGFYCFTAPPAPAILTVKQRIALLSGGQKLSMLDAFINKIPPEHLDHKLLIPLDLIQYVFNKVDEMQALSKQYMRGEVIITPAVTHLDPITREMVIDTPAVMNTPPTTQVELYNIIQPLFDDFTSGQVTAIMNAMIKWTKYDGTGTFSFYAAQIIL